MLGPALGPKPGSGWILARPDPMPTLIGHSSGAIAKTCRRVGSRYAEWLTSASGTRLDNQLSPVAFVRSNLAIHFHGMDLQSRPRMKHGFAYATSQWRHRVNRRALQRTFRPVDVDTYLY